MRKSISIIGLVTLLAMVSGCANDPFIRPPQLSLLSIYGGELHHQLIGLQRLGVQVVQYGGNVRIIILSDDLFDFNSSNISYPRGAMILDSVIAFIHAYGNVPITVTAYSDNVFTPTEALKLTCRQAKSVIGFLWSRGIVFDRLDAMGVGHSFPIATNGNSNGSAYNRHVEINMPVIPVMQR